MGMKCLGNCRAGGGSAGSPYSSHLNDTTSVAPRDVYQIAGLAKCVVIPEIWCLMMVDFGV